MIERGPLAGERLTSLGERRIIEELIKPIFSATEAVLRGIGDDTAALRVTPGHELLVTTDPCPLPVIALLGDTDYWHWGRMTHVISLSDLAASGANPLGMVVSTVMPENMLVSEYSRYLESLECYARLWGCPVVGGNIKDGPEFSSCATAFGEVPSGTSMSRKGLVPGDAVCVVGNVGHFWSAVLAHLRGWNDLKAAYADIFLRALTEPTPRLLEGQLIRRSGKATTCMDASDGLGAALQLLATANGVDVVVDGSLLPVDPCVRDAAAREGLHPLSLALSWGDWQLVFTAARDNAADLVQAVNATGVPCRLVGYAGMVTEGRLRFRDEAGNTRPLRSFGSERFRSSSYFTHGLESYLELLRLGPW